MDYNTSRKKLALPEYGRNIQRMVDYILAVDDREERNRLAYSLVNIMGNMNPQLRDIDDFKHKLWDHLAIMSDFKLDIDYPYELPNYENLNQPPNRVPYQTKTRNYRHYGNTIKLFIKEAEKLTDPEAKDALAILIAEHMKKSYYNWNKFAVADDMIFNDLATLSKGELKLDIAKVNLAEIKEPLARGKVIVKKKKIIRKK